MIRRSLSAATFIALATSWTPALAHLAPFASPAPPPPPVRFLIGLALIAIAGAVIAWQGAALAREALAHERKRHHARPGENRRGAASL
jgi:xanthosine utilization system XapX-like protein